MASKKRDLETVPPSPGRHLESYTSIRAAAPVPRAAVRGARSWGHAPETDVDENDTNDGDRVTPIFSDSITPVFSEAEVRELLARADAMERAAPLAVLAPHRALARPANTTDADASEVLQKLAGRGRHVSLAIVVAVVLTLLLLAATFFKAAAMIT
ncbi:hypothetical protein [Pendulispora albinea]|uniref:Uncharacterized protein n=1 Tax=Pendulispora albinea TaxID=2741071 RepID=A0ABZ2M5H0_9BACT